MVTMFATLLSFANETSFYSIAKDAKKTSLTLNNVKEGNKLSIKDASGVVLYKELIQKTGIYTKGFDLTSLPDGEYVFELDKDLEINTIPFTVKANDVNVNKSAETTVFKPFVNQKNNLVFISKLATNLESMHISIYEITNNNYELIHSEKVGGTNTIERVYNLGKGDYKIAITSDNKEYTTFINN